MSEPRAKEGVMDLLGRFAADHDWVGQSFEGLVEEYAEQWVAVSCGRVIASAPDLQGLLSQLSHPAHTCVKFITRQPLEVVL